MEKTLTNLPHIRPAGDGVPFAATWLITAPWAHPAWQQYALTVCDLTTHTGEAPTLYLPGATHELVLSALDPAVKVQDAAGLFEADNFRPLTPPNFGYQFQAASDEAAVDRIQAIVNLIEARNLSPDTDYRVFWDKLFSDGRSLRQS